MISFFSKIRQKLLQENRVTRYLVYAVGEILLVVIGILIALGVNNWNQDQSNRDRELKILIGLKQEFEAAANELDADLLARERHLRVAIRFQNFHLNKHPLAIPSDSIPVVFASLISTRFYSTGHPILEEISSSGGLELIRSDTIRKKIGEYVQEKNRYMAVEEREGRFVYDQLMPLLSQFVDLSIVQNNQIPSDEIDFIFQGQKGNKSYGSVLQNRITRISTSKEYGYRLRSTLQQTIDAISDDLKNRK